MPLGRDSQKDRESVPLGRGGHGVAAAAGGDRVSRGGLRGSRRGGSGSFGAQRSGSGAAPPNSARGQGSPQRPFRGAVSPDDMRSLKVVATGRGHGLEVLDGGLLGVKNDEALKDGDEYAPGSVLLYDGRYVGVVERVLGRGAFGTVCESTAGLGRPDQTLKFSRSVKSKAIRLIFGRIDVSH